MKREREGGRERDTEERERVVEVENSGTARERRPMDPNRSTVEPKKRSIARRSDRPLRPFPHLPSNGRQRAPLIGCVSRGCSIPALASMSSEINQS